MNVFAKLLFGGLLLLSVGAANAQDAHGVLRVVKGDVQIKSGKSGQTSKARIGQQVDPKDVVITGKDSRAKIVMVDNNEINVSPESQIEIEHYEFDPNAGKKEVLLNVIYGKVRAKVEQKYDGKTSKFQVKTPSAVAGVRGTDFMTSYNKADNSSSVVTFRGAVQFGLPGPNNSITNAVSVTPGKTAQVVAGAAPAPPANVPKADLAKMDNESKADGTQGGSKSDRQPSNDKKSDGKGNGAANGSGNGSTASTNSSSTGPDSSGSTSRAPSSDSGPKGGSMISSADMPASAPPPPPPVTQAAPMIIPQQPTTTTLPACSLCNQVLQKGNTSATVHIK